MRVRRANLPLVFSATLFVFFSCLWVRGLRTMDRARLIAGGDMYFVTSHPHHLLVRRAVRSDIPISRVELSFDSATAIPPRLEYLEVRAASENGLALWVPLWLPLLFLAIVPAREVLRVNRREARPGTCPACGYDLRATPDRCPECGTTPGRSSTTPGVAG